MASELTIFEPEPSGHRMQYVRHLCQGALRRGLRPRILTSTWAMEHNSTRELQRMFGDAVAFETIRPGSRVEGLARSSRAPLQKLGLWLMARHAARGLAEDAEVFVPYANLFDWPLSYLGSPFGKRPWSGIVMRETFQHRPMGVPTPEDPKDPVKEKLFLRILRIPTLRRLFSIDQSLPDYVRKGGKPGADKLFYVPDPVGMAPLPDRAAARAVFGLPPASRPILVYGALSVRKNVEVLFRVLPELPPDVVLLFVGRHEKGLFGPEAAEVYERLQREGRLFVFDRFVSVEEEAAAFAASDVVWGVYQGHYKSSGVLVQACQSDRPVLCTSEGYMGWFATKMAFAPVVDPGDEAGIVAGLGRLLTPGVYEAEYRASATRIGAEHTTERFAEILLDGVA